MHERLFTKNEIITFVRVQAWKMITIHQNVKIQQIWTGWIMLKRTTRPISVWCSGRICFLLARIHVSHAVCFWNVKAVYIKIIILKACHFYLKLNFVFPCSVTICIYTLFGLCNHTYNRRCKHVIQTWLRGL